MTSRALPLFWQTVQNGWVHRLWLRLTRHSVRLLDLDETLRHSKVQNRSYAGMRPVEISLIRGTQGKGDEFDADFYPLKKANRSRWLSVAKERLSGHGLPPVELVEVSGIYYVRDGHHRISVARSLGETFIDAEVIRMSLDTQIR
jgi:hypothetical protein